MGTTDASSWSGAQGLGFPPPQTSHLSHGQLSVEGPGVDLPVEEALYPVDMLSIWIGLKRQVGEVGFGEGVRAEIGDVYTDGGGIRAEGGV